MIEQLSESGFDPIEIAVITNVYSKLGYRLPPKLELIGEVEIKAELTRIQPEGFVWDEPIQSELVRYRAIANKQLAADQKAIEGVK